MATRIAEDDMKEPYQIWRAGAEKSSATGILTAQTDRKKVHKIWKVGGQEILFPEKINLSKIVALNNCRIIDTKHTVTFTIFDSVPPMRFEILEPERIILSRIFFADSVPKYHGPKPLCRII